VHSVEVGVRQRAGRIRPVLKLDELVEPRIPGPQRRRVKPVQLSPVRATGVAGDRLQRREPGAWTDIQASEGTGEMQARGACEVGGIGLSGVARDVRPALNPGEYGPVPYP
jgi:hypothetical protein